MIALTIFVMLVCSAPGAGQICLAVPDDNGKAMQFETLAQCLPHEARLASGATLHCVSRDVH